MALRIVLFIKKKSVPLLSWFPDFDHDEDWLDVKFVWKNKSKSSFSANDISLNIVSVILRLARSVLVHHVQIHINTGIQKPSFLFAVSNATRLFRRRLQPKPSANFVDTLPLLASTSYMSPLVFLFMIQALG